MDIFKSFLTIFFQVKTSLGTFGMGKKQWTRVTVTLLYIKPKWKWINEISTVPVYYPAKPLPREQTGLEKLAGKEDPVELDYYNNQNKL